MIYLTVIFLVAFSTMVSASHFRGGIFMVRPLAEGESATDVSIINMLLLLLLTFSKTLAGNLCFKKF